MDLPYRHPVKEPLSEPLKVGAVEIASGCDRDHFALLDEKVGSDGHKKRIDVRLPANDMFHRPCDFGVLSQLKVGRVHNH
jgi:hypothetical protein